MRASRSAASTTAPHFVILSTSFVHAPLLRRCWRMMRASWHSRQAAVALACMGPAGRSAVTPADCWAWAEMKVSASRARIANGGRGLKPTSFGKLNAALKRRSSTVLQRSTARLRSAASLGFAARPGFVALHRCVVGHRSTVVRGLLGLGDMDFHLVYGVVEIAAGIPDWGGGLGAALT